MKSYWQLLGRFIQEKAIDIVAFFLTQSLIALILYLQNLNLQDFKVAFLMPFLIFVIYLCIAFYRFQSLHHFLTHVDTDNLPVFSDQSLLGQDYQEIINKLNDDNQKKYQDLVKFDKDLLDLTKLWTHQMKVPLSALDLMAQTDRLNRSDVQNQLLELDNYLNILLSYLRLQHTTTDFRFEKFDVADITRTLIKKYANQFIMKDLSVTVSGSWLVTSDQKWLTVAIEQVINNAVKYTKSGQVVISLDDGLMISDTGIGIMPEDLPRLFEHGFTGYNGRRNKKSTGLGLYLTKGILDKLDFEIDIQSQIDQGTRVNIKKYQ